MLTQVRDYEELYFYRGEDYLPQYLWFIYADLFHSKYYEEIPPKELLYFK